MSGLQPFSALSPERALDLIDACGHRTDGRFIALNSYENRVFQVGLEDADPLVAKFYRPGRWSDRAIIEEHTFTAELADAEIPVVAPMADAHANTLHCLDGFRFSLFRRCGGRAPELDNPDHLLQLGRFLARIHNVGAQSHFSERPVVDIDTYIHAPCGYILGSNMMPSDLATQLELRVTQLVRAIEDIMQRTGPLKTLRLHGDCHPGNILQRDERFHIVDFDDCRTGPAVQDLFLFIGGDRAEQTRSWAELLDGYLEFRDFDPRELSWIEVQRTLRLVHYAGWLAQRIDDPTFAPAFPDFNSRNYWQSLLAQLEEQLLLLEHPPIQLW